jgi:hypothetical protein
MRPLSSLRRRAAGVPEKADPPRPLNSPYDRPGEQRKGFPAVAVQVVHIVTDDIGADRSHLAVHISDW